MRPRLLETYCCAGGAGKGYADAGFEVVGVDNRPQPHYPFKFIQADALEVLADHDFLSQFAAVHASPPCQRDSRMTNCRPGLAGEYPQLIGPTRDLLTAWGGPWIIENVDGADVARQDNLLGANGLLLCGFMFGLRLYRHRLFEANVPLAMPHHPRHSIPASKAGHWEPGTIISVSGNCAPITEARAAMGIDWMPRDYLREAIPPAYTKYIGRLLLGAITNREAA